MVNFETNTSAKFDGHRGTDKKRDWHSDKTDPNRDSTVTVTVASRSPRSTKLTMTERDSSKIKDSGLARWWHDLAGIARSDLRNFSASRIPEDMGPKDAHASTNCSTNASNCACSCGVIGGSIGFEALL